MFAASKDLAISGSLILTARVACSEIGTCCANVDTRQTDRQTNRRTSLSRKAPLRGAMAHWGKMYLNCYSWLKISIMVKLWSILTCFFGVDGELVDLVGRALFETLTPSLDLWRVAFTNLQLERRVGDWFTVLEHVHEVFTHFVWTEQDPCRTAQIRRDPPVP